MNVAANKMTNETWVTLCPLEELTINDGVCALVADEQVAVFKVGDDESDIYAISNFDPFGNANVLSRGIVGDVKGKAVVSSPLYKQHFCLESGQCLQDENVKLKTFTVRVNDGIVEILEKA